MTNIHPTEITEEKIRKAILCRREDAEFVGRLVEILKELDGKILDEEQLQRIEDAVGESVEFEKASSQKHICVNKYCVIRIGVYKNTGGYRKIYTTDNTWTPKIDLAAWMKERSNKEIFGIPQENARLESLAEDKESIANMVEILRRFHAQYRSMIETASNLYNHPLYWFVSTEPNNTFNMRDMYIHSFNIDFEDMTKNKDEND